MCGAGPQLLHLRVHRRAVRHASWAVRVVMPQGVDEPAEIAALATFVEEVTQLGKIGGAGLAKELVVQPEIFGGDVVGWDAELSAGTGVVVGRSTSRAGSASAPREQRRRQGEGSSKDFWERSEFVGKGQTGVQRYARHDGVSDEQAGLAHDGSVG